MVTSVLVVIVTVRGILRGFEPVTDNGLFELRAWDVLTADHPLLGTWSSASVSSNVDVNHPGPLLFDWFALPVRVFGGATGLAVGSALLTLVAIWVSVLTARRLGGRSAALAVAVAVAVLCWSMGSELLFDPWPPNLLVLPFFAFLVTIWAVAVGWSWGLVLAVAIGSLCMQSHLSYLFIVPGLLVAGVVALAVTFGHGRWATHRRPLLVSAAVGLLAWAQPLWEQLTGGSDGNIAMLATSGTSGIAGATVCRWLCAWPGRSSPCRHGGVARATSRRSRSRHGLTTVTSTSAACRRCLLAARGTRDRRRHPRRPHSDRDQARRPGDGEPARCWPAWR